MAVSAAIVASTSCGSGAGGLFRQYQYEEEIYLSLDGSATVYVHASIAALDLLRGASFDASPGAPLDRDAVRAFYTSPVTRVTASPTTSRRAGRRFVHVRLDVRDIRQLRKAAPFAWSTYDFHREGDVYVFRQTVGHATPAPASKAGWNGRELVAFRLHLPSEIVDHNAGAGNPKRGNILVWEQPLLDRVRGEPLAFEARIKTESILYHTLWLFATTFGAVAVAFVFVIWWLLRPRTTT